MSGMSKVNTEYNLLKNLKMQQCILTINQMGVPQDCSKKSSVISFSGRKQFQFL